MLLWTGVGFPFILVSLWALCGVWDFWVLFRDLEIVFLVEFELRIVIFKVLQDSDEMSRYFGAISRDFEMTSLEFPSVVSQKPLLLS